METSLRRRLDAALALLSVIAFATLSMAFSAATAVALALVTGIVGAIVWESGRPPDTDESR
jgi:hypothetical protein